MPREAPPLQGWICRQYNEIVTFLRFGGPVMVVMVHVPCYILLFFLIAFFRNPASWIYWKNQRYFHDFKIDTFQVLQVLDPNLAPEDPFRAAIGRACFLFWGGEFVLGITKYGRLCFLVRSWGLLWIMHSVTFLQCFRWMCFANRRGEFIKTNVFFTISK